MKKMRSDVISNIVIYILVLVLITVIFFKADKMYIGELNKKIYINSLINNQSYKIVDENGMDISKHYIVDNVDINNEIQKVYLIEICVLILVLIIGLVIIVLDINLKFKKLDKASYNILKNIETLKLIESKDKYIEISNIYENINKAIYSIQAKEDYKNRVIENLAHDILTPLHIIEGNIELYENSLEMDLDIVKDNLKKLSNLTTLELSRREYEYEVIKTKEIIDYFIGYSKVYNNVEVKLKIDDNIKFKTKKISFYRIIDNIVNNAVIHGKASEILIYLTEENNMYKLVIENDGLKIDDNKLSKIFERNYTSGGNGLGLAIVDELIKDLEYEIKVVSDEKRTAFIIFIPKKIN